VAPVAPAPTARPDDAGLELTFGLRAALAVLARRPNDIRRLVVSSAARAEAQALELARQLGIELCEGSDAELERLTGSKQHEGVALFARPRLWTAPRELAQVLVARRGVAVVFDRVRNPFNIGAILRTAAFFGVDGALFGPLAPAPGLTGTAVRVAEGGVEHLLLARTTDLGHTLARLRAAGVHVYGADGHARTSAFGFSFERPAVLVLGNEREGLSPAVRSTFEATLAIPGRGAVESLNVSVAGSILLAELARSGR
ncbi:MAG: RNA methyltransferase, partial [Polyangiaceae bacterium]|nr:RNA methyltransferase [Polyangiaceae bacterium]